MSVGIPQPEHGLSEEEECYQRRLARARKETVTVDPKAGRWLIQGDSDNTHIVEFEDGEPVTCWCPDCQKNGHKCKHIIAIEQTLYDYVGSINGDTVEVSQ